MRSSLFFSFILLAACVSSPNFGSIAEKLPSSMTDNVLADCGDAFQKTNQDPDRVVIPLVFTPPIIPQNLEKSGHCIVMLNVDKAGKVSDAMTKYCTDDVFREAALRSVSKWIYSPNILNGEAVERCGVTSQVTFELTDENGNKIPE